MSDQILDFSDLAPQRQQVRLEAGGDLYDMVSPVELSIAERAELFGLHTRIERLTEKKTQSKSDLTEIESLTNKAVRQVLPDAPEDVLARLPYMIREAVMLGFFAAYGSTMREIATRTGGEGLAEAMMQASTSAS